MDIRTVINVAVVISAAQRNSRVARLMPVTGDIVYGTARRITGDTSDALKANLEVTTVQGWEISWPVAELAEEVEVGEFVVYPAR